MKKYQEPSLEIIYFDQSDVITTSSPPDEGTVDDDH